MHLARHDRSAGRRFAARRSRRSVGGARRRVWVGLLTVASALLVVTGVGCDRATTVAEGPVASTVAKVSNVGFRTPSRLEEHYRKHGREFGTISQAEYLRRAQALRDAPVGGDVVELVRSDGRITRFDRNSGAFIAFDRDGIIRTYFKPNDGEAYFRRQARR